MILKAIIEGLIDEYTYKVRIPRYDKASYSSYATSYNDLRQAIVCALPGINPYYYKDEVVFVEFENDDNSFPIILGRLFREEDSKKSSSDSEFNDIRINNTCNLVSKPFFGDTLINIESTLKNSSENIQNLINLLSKRISKIDDLPETEGDYILNVSKDSSGILNYTWKTNT